uniref:NEDD4 binding protein 3 n=1 Tax=Xiphophorus couchianus TaxID=32473 RepID=A0A3B5LN10_9TELE
FASCPSPLFFVGSLVEKPDVSPTKGNRAVPQVRPRQTNGLLKKGLTQRELLNYLNITSGNGKRDVIGGLVEDDVFAKVYSKDGTEIDLSKNSLPSGGKYEKVNVRELRLNEILIACVVSSPFPSASMGHINTIGSLDRTSQGLKAAGSGGMAMGEVACRSMATLNRLTPYGSEAPPPYEWTLSLSVEDRGRHRSGESHFRSERHFIYLFIFLSVLTPSARHLQVFEGKQRLWEKEVEELKRLYAAKLRQVSQHAQRSQRSMQLELFRAQQEKNRLQEELDGLKRDAVRDVTAVPKPTSPTLEETRWEVCQKSGEISLLKQQVRDSQAEVTQKLSEIFKLKTQLRETRTELRNREAQIDALNIILQGTQRGKCSSAGESKKGAEESPSAGATGGSGGPTEERLRAELLLERRQSEAQATAFEEERNTWQTEKDKVIRYQKELQASYLEMYHRNEALERELQQLRAGGARIFSSGQRFTKPRERKLDT